MSQPRTVTLTITLRSPFDSVLACYLDTINEQLATDNRICRTHGSPIAEPWTEEEALSTILLQALAREAKHQGVANCDPWDTRGDG